MNLSKNFTLSEFLRSERAAALKLSNQPTPEHLENMRRLCRDILQPARDSLARGITITSGYRSLELNKAVGGVTPTASKRGSQHLYGEAADIRVSGMTPYDVCEWFATSALPFDQLIHEKIGNSVWTHVSIAPVGRAPRREVLTYDGKTYRHGLHGL